MTRSWRGWRGRRRRALAGSRCWWAGHPRGRPGRAGRRWKLLREQAEPWRLWHPIDPSRPEAALRELPLIGPRTVIWLNEAQFYLDAPVSGLGERVAAGLRELLRDPAGAPVVALATLWPQFWDTLTARPAAGEETCTPRPGSCWRPGHQPCPPRSLPLSCGSCAVAADPRLVLAAESAETGRSSSSWPEPELMARYRNAPPAAAALINAAIDARRLGMGIALPLTFLEAAAPGYLTDADWDALAEDWLEQALTYTAAPCKGIRGALPASAPAADIATRQPGPRTGSPTTSSSMAATPAVRTPPGRVLDGGGSLRRPRRPARPRRRRRGPRPVP